MPRLIGMDEAGYGPNFGPLVISATAWEIPHDPHACDLWKLLKQAVSRNPCTAQRRIQIADSKQIFSPAKGLCSLETSVLSLLRWGNCDVSSFHAIWKQLSVHFPSDGEQEPWFFADLPLPVAASCKDLDRYCDRLMKCAEKIGLTAPRIRSDVVLTEKFNRLTAQHDSKGLTLSSLSVSLLSRLWNASETDSALIVADKHGGRNRYDHLLASVTDGAMIFRVEEGRDRSTYRIGKTEIRFETKAESHFPVAVASMVSKYLRELAMLAFNRFWKTHLPNLKPTQGYPGDSHRFRSEIAACQAALKIPDQILWRER